MRFLLRPGWLALIAVVLGFVVACYTLLAPWQFGREAQREAQQQAIDAANTTPPVPLAQLVEPGAGVTPDVEWRQVEVTGTYLPDDQGLVRLRVVDGRPAVEVLTPFRTSDGRLLTVDRGTVETSSGAVTPDVAAPPAGEVTLTARLRLDQTDPEGRVLDEAGFRQLYVADSRLLASATGLALEPGWLQLAADQPGVLSPLPVAPVAGGAPFTNLSYALQWITFGVIALLALGYFIRLELLQRRGRPDRSALRRALSGEDDEAPLPH
ncbi:SURF1 family protein [Pseudonocardia broussonetiae]|uniref:SURF1-like protein n=1 Tax=Pseudonocardia broussonetiae TaxID=2736640 RepID=A0A6M6JMQ0_9PSEU|nr:SURF1 family cytochrome oxidase biogenesis protein [Pseudonocardia broussonetiae]QJY47581.1 SURF1 family protein [Pseudonocardia broussonetiae]